MLKLPHPKAGKKEPRVAGEDLVVSVPLVRIRNRIGVDVPVAVIGVPVAVDRPELTLYYYPSVCHGEQKREHDA